ncbi:hypothetical protein F511_22066 [Dorcoceras hygrometricum]|uniref:Uncharacterized protein n=1 Tax=Dorcoceras hygrometricum TaxID=472368 RepID=A0A2Z7C4E8_9LAMI|nr:hypothetical protein F511_22066 [Dorcoceras hygrometricum]
MGCPGQARTKPRSKLAIATMPETSPDGGSTAAATANKSGGSSRISPRQAGRTAARASSSHRLRNLRTGQRPASASGLRIHQQLVGLHARRRRPNSRPPTAHPVRMSRARHRAGRGAVVHGGAMAVIKEKFFVSFNLKFKIRYNMA